MVERVFLLFPADIPVFCFLLLSMVEDLVKFSILESNVEVP